MSLHYRAPRQERADPASILHERSEIARDSAVPPGADKVEQSLLHRRVCSIIPVCRPAFLFPFLRFLCVAVLSPCSKKHCLIDLLSPLADWRQLLPWRLPSVASVLRLHICQLAFLSFLRLNVCRSAPLQSCVDSAVPCARRPSLDIHRLEYRLPTARRNMHPLFGVGGVAAAAGEPFRYVNGRPIPLAAFQCRDFAVRCELANRDIWRSARDMPSGLSSEQAVNQRHLYFEYREAIPPGLDVAFARNAREVEYADRLANVVQDLEWVSQCAWFDERLLFQAKSMMPKDRPGTKRRRVITCHTPGGVGSGVRETDMESLQRRNFAK